MTANIIFARLACLGGGNQKAIDVLMWLDVL